MKDADDKDNYQNWEVKCLYCLWSGNIDQLQKSYFHVDSEEYYHKCLCGSICLEYNEDDN